MPAQRAQLQVAEAVGEEQEPLVVMVEPHTFSSLGKDNMKYLVILLFFIAGCTPAYIQGQDPFGEMGLMTACWEENGSVIYSLLCEHPQRITWPRESIPLHVNLDTPAVAVINSQFACPLLTTAPTDDPEIRVTLDGPSEGGLHPGGFTSHYTVSGRLHAYVQTQLLGGPGEEGRTIRVLTHELLHALGLAHDPFHSSVMYPITDWDPTMEPVRVTQVDRSLLNALYCD